MHHFIPTTISDLKVAIISILSPTFCHLDALAATIGDEIKTIVDNSVAAKRLG